MLTCDDFASKLNSVFKIHHPDGTLSELRLIEAKRLSHKMEGASRDPFTLLFRAPVDHKLEQRTYRIDHPNFEELDIFLVPVAADSEGYYLEAVFN